DDSSALRHGYTSRTSPVGSPSTIGPPSSPHASSGSPSKQCATISSRWTIVRRRVGVASCCTSRSAGRPRVTDRPPDPLGGKRHVEVAHSQVGRSEEQTSELQSPDHLVCRLL